MDNERLRRGLAFFSTGYVKRWMENNYDRLMTTAPGKRLMELDKSTRYGIEAALYAVMAYGEQKLPDHAPWQKLLKEVLLDAPPEISKRLVNGFREDYIRNSGNGEIALDRNLGSRLEGLDATQLASLLKWASELTPDEMDQFRGVIRHLSKEQLDTFCSLSSDERKAFLTIFKDVTVKPTEKEKPRRSPALKAQIDAARERVREEHRKLRERKAAK
jgi:hypothetical protein